MTTRVGLCFPAELSFDTWEQAGHKIFRLIDSSAWCLGDWLVYGQDRYTDRYRNAVEAAGLDYQTLRNYAWVARRFPHERRRDTVSFQHHAEVAALPPDAQDRWLRLAEEHSWSRNQLRRQLHKSGRESFGQDDPLIVQRLRASADRVERWREAAARSRHDLEDWIVESLDAAAAQALTTDTAAAAPALTTAPTDTAAADQALKTEPADVAPLPGLLERPAIANGHRTRG